MELIFRDLILSKGEQAIREIKAKVTEICWYSAALGNS